MDFDDIFEKRNMHHSQSKHHSNRDHQWYDNDHEMGRSFEHGVDYGQHNHHGQEGEFHWISLYDRIKSNPRLRGISIVAGIIILLLLILLIILLLPLIGKIIHYIMQNGLKGIFGEISQFLGKIWNGNA